MPRAALLALLLSASVAHAHYHMLLPNKHSVKAEEEVTFTYQFGHPFEHELSDTAEPAAVFVIRPDGETIDLTKGLKKVTSDGAGGKKVTGYEFKFTPPKRGDYIVVAVSPAIKSEGHTLKDVTKVVLHAQTQNGWDNSVLDSKVGMLDLQPLTRPYGITPGVAFHVEVRHVDPRDVPRCPVEVEKYNPTAPKEIPADEFVTRTHRTSRIGTAVVTLSEAGWWGITAIKSDDKAEHRCTLWVHVDEKAK